MLEATTSTELVEWFAYLRITDKERKEEQAQLLGGMF